MNFKSNGRSIFLCFRPFGMAFSKNNFYGVAVMK